VNCQRLERAIGNEAYLLNTLLIYLMGLDRKVRTDLLKFSGENLMSALDRSFPLFS
jgi:hypothetical protein